MAQIVSLRQARKQRSRAENERQAAENRAVHGRAKAEMNSNSDARAKTAAFVDGHRRTKPDPGSVD